MVAYISGILNSKNKTLNKIIGETSSAAFFIDSNGNETPIKKIQRYKKIKSVSHVERIGELNLVQGESKTFPSLFHRVGPGTFNRRLISVTDHKGCDYSGMLETQTLN